MTHPFDEAIVVTKAKEHNLKGVNVTIPKRSFVVITGISGSGKSSLAFDTIYAEGQRRYVESLSAYARQFLEMQDKPDVESITGLSPAIAIEQKTTSKNPRSTVSTVTEIYDYLRLLFARAGIAYSPTTGKPIVSQTVTQMVDKILALPTGAKIHLLAPIVRGRKGEYIKEMLQLKKQGFSRIKIDGTIHQLEDLPSLDKQKKHDIAVIVDRLVINEDLGNRLPESIESALHLSSGLLYVEVLDPESSEPVETLIFSEHFSCPESGFTIEEIAPRLFSFNSPHGACSACDGLGTEYNFSESLIVPDPSLSVSEGAIKPWSRSHSRLATHYAQFFEQLFEALSQHYNFSLHTPFEELPKDIQAILLHGSNGEAILVQHKDGFRTFSTKKPFEGVIPNLRRRFKESESFAVKDELARFQTMTSCHLCHGYRLREEALSVKIADKNVGEICALTIEQAVEFFKNLPPLLNSFQRQVAEQIIKEINHRLSFLQSVGLEYLTLNRESGTLSGGESQRIRLASQIGSGLCGVLYVLDEPSIGLHQCDNDRLLVTLQYLRDMGNTVIVVEHDEDTMRMADYVVDVGPGAGIHGGHIVACGTPEEIMNNPASITGAYLSGREYIPVPKKRRPFNTRKLLELTGVRTNNLKNIDATIPLQTFTCVTGVSGGGKSSLVIHTLYRALMKHLHNSKTEPGPYASLTGLEHIDKLIEIDQSPIGRTPRSNPATYTGAFGPIRDWFTNLPESKARGYKPGRFSFNVKGGRCESCQGDGVIKIEMHFLPDIYVTCDECKGARYNRETLEVKYKNKSIAEVLDMTVEEAKDFFTSIPLIYEKLFALNEVGLGYIKLGQSATTLSGGEAQRVKLAKELSKRSTGRTFYILDEPTTGLHTDDIKKLLKVLHQLVCQGNTVLVIEHNLDVIKTADHIIDIGPGGGYNGGVVVATGTPEDIITQKDSKTGAFLKPLLEKAHYENSLFFNEEEA